MNGLKGDYLPAIFVASLTLFHIVCLRGLYADGSYFALSVITLHAFTNWDPVRMFAQFLTQLPLWLAIELGVTRTTALLLIHSLGLLGVPAVLWCFALCKLRDDPLLWPFLGLYCIAAIGPGFFAIGEGLLASSLAAASLAILLRGREPTMVDAGFLLFAGIILFRAYETAVFLGPMLGIAAWLRARRLSRGWLRTAILASAVLFTASAMGAAWSILYPRLTNNRTQAGGLDWLLQDRSFLLSVAIFALYLAVWFGAAASRRTRAAAVGAIVLALGALAIPYTWAFPVTQYGVRAFAGIVMFLFGIAAIHWRFAETRPAIPAPMSWAVPAALAALLVIPDVLMTVGFRDYVGNFRNIVNARSGLLPIEESGIDQTEQVMFGNPWVNPALSLLLRSDSSGAIIMNARGEWQPFDPKSDPGANAALVVIYKFVADQGDENAKRMLSRLQ